MKSFDNFKSDFATFRHFNLLFFYIFQPQQRRGVGPDAGLRPANRVATYRPRRGRLRSCYRALTP